MSPPPWTRYATTVTVVGEQVGERVDQRSRRWLAEGAPPALDFFTVLHPATWT